VANDILNAILPSDKAGLYWALGADGATDSAATIFGANGSPGVNPLAHHGDSRKQQFLSDQRHCRRPLGAHR
jgi:hypothetical protein